MSENTDSRQCTQENNFYRREDGMLLCFSCNNTPIACFCREKWKAEDNRLRRIASAAEGLVKALEEIAEFKKNWVEAALDPQRAVQIAEEGLAAYEKAKATEGGSGSEF